MHGKSGKSVELFVCFFALQGRRALAFGLSAGLGPELYQDAAVHLLEGDVLREAPRALRWYTPPWGGSLLIFVCLFIRVVYSTGQRKNP